MFKAVKVDKRDSAKSLFLLADLAKKYKTTGPKDLSTNLDKYLWGFNS